MRGAFVAFVLDDMEGCAELKAALQACKVEHAALPVGKATTSLQKYFKEERMFADAADEVHTGPARRHT